MSTNELSDVVPRIDNLCAGGCGGRFSDEELRQVLTQANLLGQIALDLDKIMVDQNTGDDAAVYCLTDELALICSVDVGRPVVGSAFISGGIAVANALSDIYAMGGRVIGAQNIVGWPRSHLQDGSAARALMGGEETLQRAGIRSAGGHTMHSEEPFYGVAVQGLAHPDKLITNASGKPGDALILTKPLGSGLSSSAILDGVIEERTKAAAIETMLTLNNTASEIAVEHGVKTGTDITGSGLLGHLHKITVFSSACGAEIDASLIPVIPGVADLAIRGLRTAAGIRNLRHAESFTKWTTEDEATKVLMSDPQTSGGLLLATNNPKPLLSTLAAKGVHAVIIGRLTEAQGIMVTHRI